MLNTICFVCVYISRYQDQVKEIQGIVEMKVINAIVVQTIMLLPQVPSDQNRTGSAIMTDAPEQADTNPYRPQYMRGFIHM